MKAISKAGKPLRFFTLLCYIFMHPEQTKTTLCFRENMKKLFVGDIPTAVVTLSKGQMFNSKKRISRGFHFFELQKIPIEIKVTDKSFLLILQRITVSKNQRKKVSFISASEASYVYIILRSLKWQKLSMLASF